MRRITLILLLGVSEAAAAQLPRIDPGKRIKVEMDQPRSRIRGTFLSQTDDSIQGGFSNASHGIALSDIARISASGGKSRALGAVRGLKVGAAAGSVFGLGIIGIGYVTEGGPAAQLPLAFAAWAAVGAVVGASYGVVIGTAIGAERWNPVYTRPTPGRAPGLGLSLRF